MANKSSFMLAVLLIANPFMLLFFQNCSAQPPTRAVASVPAVEIPVDKASLTDSKVTPH